MSIGKKILFRILPFLFIGLLLVLLEVGLRLISPTDRSQLVFEVTYDGIDWYETNRSYLWKYFPANSPTIPEFKPMLFKQKKDRNLFRVFCLGGSTMFGTPYEMTTNIPGIVRKQLRHLYSKEEFEVINFGASAINSNVVRDLAGRLLEFKPDLVLLYLGHNEFYGPDGIGASYPEKVFPFLTRVKYRLRELRIVQVVQSWLRKIQTGGKPTDEMNLMRQVSEGNLVRLGSSDAQRVFDNFESNLVEIVRTFQNAGIRIIASDVSSNLLFPPFVSDSIQTSEDWHRVQERIRVENDSIRVESEEGILQSLFQQDSTNAFVNYWLGRLWLDKGERAEARRFLSRARENDLLKFRAPQAINSIIRRVCRERSVPCVSGDTAFMIECGGIPDDSAFWEHLHPTARGYYIVANEFMKAITAHNLVEAKARTNSRLLPFQVDSLSMCWLDLAYADLSIRHLTGRWPFTSYHRESVVLDQSPVEVQKIALDVYSRKITWDEGCYSSAAYFWRSGNTRAAQTTYEALLEEYPYNFYSHYLLGNLLNTIGKSDRAIEHYLISIRSNPRYPNARLDLGLIEVNAGRFDEAIRQFRVALELIGGGKREVPLRANVLYGLGAAYANKSMLDSAVICLDEALRLIPDYRDALRLRTQILQRK